MRKGTKKVDGVGRRQAVLDYIWAVRQPVTVHDIAYNLHMEPSTYLRKICAELERDGYLISREVSHRKTGKVTTKKLYRLKSDTMDTQSQLELWS